METPASCSSQPLWRSHPFRPFPLSSSLLVFRRPQCDGAAASARLDVRNSFEPRENDRYTPSSSLSREWAAFSSKLVDGAVSYLHQDWRAVRAHLWRAQFDQLGTDEIREAGTQWAHEIPILEEGCVLLATENLDSHPVLRKSVVLLLNIDNGSIRGIILNRALPFPSEEVSNVDIGVALGLGSCPTFLGGPLHTASSFHLLSARLLDGFEPFLPGIHRGSDQTALFSAWNSIRRNRIAPEEVRVHVGQMEWDARSLSAEILVFQWWRLVSCSSSLLHLQDGDCMWEEVHRLVSEFK